MAKFRVDRDLCTGSGSCTFHAPETFDVDEGMKVALLDGKDSDAAVIAAVESCPSGALTLVPEQAAPPSALDLTLFGAEHVRRYVETDGAVGHEWNGVTCLVLWTVGRRTGTRRATPLIYGRDGANVVVIASQGGAPTHPAWYLNLTADPRVDVQVGADRFTATARTATGEERERLWALMAERWPNYQEYKNRTSREIPLVVLERS